MSLNCRMKHFEVEVVSASFALAKAKRKPENFRLKPNLNPLEFPNAGFFKFYLRSSASSFERKPLGFSLLGA